MRITEPGYILQDKVIEGDVIIAAPNVTIRRNIIDGRRNVLYGIKTEPEGRYALIEDNHIKGALNKGVFSGSGYTRVSGGSITDCGEDGFFTAADYTDVLGVTMHGNGWKVGGHSDGAQIMGGRNHRIIGNKFILPHGVGGLNSNSCVYVEANWSDVRNVVIAGNVTDGGLYCIWILNGREFKAHATTCRVSDNQIGRHFYRPLNVLGGVEMYGNRPLGVSPGGEAIEPFAPPSIELALTPTDEERALFESIVAHDEARS